GGVVHAGGDADEVLLGFGLGREALRAQVLLEAALGEAHALGLAFRDAARGLAAQRADETLEVAHARFARVRGDDARQRAVGERDLAGLEAVLHQLAREQ